MFKMTIGIVLRERETSMMCRNVGLDREQLLYVLNPIHYLMVSLSRTI